MPKQIGLNPYRFSPICLGITFSNAGDVVFDPFMGSGTTGLACLQTGRGFIGVEREEEYLQAAQERLRNAAVTI